MTDGRESSALTGPAIFRLESDPYKNGRSASFKIPTSESSRYTASLVLTYVPSFIRWIAAMLRYPLILSCSCGLKRRSNAACPEQSTHSNNGRNSPPHLGRALNSSMADFASSAVSEINQ